MPLFESHGIRGGEGCMTREGCGFGDGPGSVLVVMITISFLVVYVPRCFWRTGMFDSGGMAVFGRGDCSRCGHSVRTFIFYFFILFSDCGLFVFKVAVYFFATD